MILLDTSVLLYAVGDEHALQEPCRRIVDRIGDGALQATTAVGVIQEFMHVYAIRRSRRAAAASARRYTALLGPLAEAGEHDLALAVDLFEARPGLQAFDALLAATALNSRAEALVTADRAFAGIPGLVVLDPRSPELETLVG
ncbi:MAG: type II toxin-antitoxin system VapC family toxin [Thermoleophilia bacterium]|nr:type II toxin-antitoxin system VapC family toxin [Thermoleophilia bacterium]